MTDDQDPQDPLEALKALKKKQQGLSVASASADPLAALKALKASTPPKSFAGRGATRTFGDEGESAHPLAHLLNAAQGLPLPGIERLEASAGAIGPMSYQESLAALRGEINKIPDIPTPVPGLGGAGGVSLPGLRTAERIPGAIYGGARIGANALVQRAPAWLSGLFLGGASGALDADSMSVAKRAGKAGLGAAIGAASGWAFDKAGRAIQGRSARTPGDLAVDVTQKNAAADAASYAPVEAEVAASRGMSPAVSDVMHNDPVIAKYAARVRSSPLYETADDATVLIKAKELLTDVQRRAERSMVSADNDIATGTRLAAEEAAAAKNRIRQAAATSAPGYPAVAPSLGKADMEKAIRESEREFMEKASDVGRRVIKGSSQAAKKLATKSPEAFLREDLANATPEQRELAYQAFLSRLKESSSIWHPKKSLQAMSRLAPFIKATQSDAQRALDALVRAGTAYSATR